MNPFREHPHGQAGVGITLYFAPGAGFGKAQAMEDADDQVDALGRADQEVLS
jgi:hypothetical protein